MRSNSWRYLLILHNQILPVVSLGRFEVDVVDRFEVDVLRVYLCRLLKLELLTDCVK